MQSCLFKHLVDAEQHWYSIWGLWFLSSCLVFGFYRPVNQKEILSDTFLTLSLFKRYWKLQEELRRCKRLTKDNRSGDNRKICGQKGGREEEEQHNNEKETNLAQRKEGGKGEGGERSVVLVLLSSLWSPLTPLITMTEGGQEREKVSREEGENLG